LGIVVLKDQGIVGSRERQEELDALLDLFAEFCECAPNGMKQEIKKLFRHVQFALPALVSFCQPLDAVQQKAIQQLGETAVHLIGWAWQHRAILGPKRDLLIADFPPAWQPLAAELLAAWDEAVRSSSLTDTFLKSKKPIQRQKRFLIVPQNRREKSHWPGFPRKSKQLLSFPFLPDLLALRSISKSV
jgi:hypothetical protein